MLKIKGVDMSYCQEGIDYTALKEAGVKFAIIRAGIGTREDSLLDTHVKGCVANGIAYGFYWYSLAYNVEDAKAEAAACLKAIARYGRPAYPVFFDMEKPEQVDKLDRKTRTDMALAFCKAVEDGGYPAGVYANPSWLECYYEKSRIVGKYDIWLAHWTNDPNYPSKYDYGQTMWQWGIDNIGMDIDGDICFINYPAKTAYWYDTHTQPAAAQPAPTPAPTPKPAPSGTTFKVGDKVTIKEGAYWTTGDKVPSFCYGVVYTVDSVATDNVLLDSDGVNSRIAPKYLELAASESTVTFKVGDMVRIKQGSYYYESKIKVPNWVCANKYRIDAISGDRVLLDSSGLNSAVASKDLIKA